MHLPMPTAAATGTKLIAPDPMSDPVVGSAHR
jgi:hypothetical protein